MSISSRSTDLHSAPGIHFLSHSKCNFEASFSDLQKACPDLCFSLIADCRQSRVKNNLKDG